MRESDIARNQPDIRSNAYRTQILDVARARNKRRKRRPNSAILVVDFF